MENLKTKKMYSNSTGNYLKKYTETGCINKLKAGMPKVLNDCDDCLLMRKD